MIYSVYYALYIVHCIAYTVYHTRYNLQCTVVYIDPTLLTQSIILEFHVIISSLKELLKDQLFAVFAFLVIIFTIYVQQNVPETKNKTFEEISLTFNKKCNSLNIK